MDKIYTLQNRLNELLLTRELTDEEVVRVSKELDKEILKGITFINADKKINIINKNTF